jgi:hypothetical protein
MMAGSGANQGTRMNAHSDNERLYPALTGVHYIEFLTAMHAHMNPNWYFEIGTMTGESLVKANCNFISVDPEFRLDRSVIGSQKEAHFFQCTSDEFFGSRRFGAIAESFDMAFLDGMHLFEYLLRDFIGAEKLAGQGAAIVLHDIVPITYVAAKRTWDSKETFAWTGDVWKIIPVLRRLRPDLVIDVVDCPPSGLAVIRNLDPKNRVLEDQYDQIVKNFIGLEIDDFGKDVLAANLNVLSHLSTRLRVFCGNAFRQSSKLPSSKDNHGTFAMQHFGYRPHKGR